MSNTEKAKMAQLWRLKPQLKVSQPKGLCRGEMPRLHVFPLVVGLVITSLPSSAGFHGSHSFPLPGRSHRSALEHATRKLPSLCPPIQFPIRTTHTMCVSQQGNSAESESFKVKAEEFLQNRRQVHPKHQIINACHK